MIQLVTASIHVVSGLAAHSAAHGHKQGHFAVVASIIGVIAFIVIIVLLASVSARRRGLIDVQKKGISDRQPPRRDRGLFG